MRKSFLLQFKVDLGVMDIGREYASDIRIKLYMLLGIPIQYK